MFYLVYLIGRDWAGIYYKMLVWYTQNDKIPKTNCTLSVLQNNVSVWGCIFPKTTQICSLSFFSFLPVKYTKRLKQNRMMSELAANRAVWQGMDLELSPLFSSLSVRESAFPSPAREEARGISHGSMRILTIIAFDHPLADGFCRGFLYSLFLPYKFYTKAVSIWGWSECNLSAGHPYWWEYHSESSMIRKRIVLRPHSFLHFRGEENCILHTKTNGLLLGTLHNFIPGLVDIFISLLWPCWIPNSLLQCHYLTM